MRFYEDAAVMENVASGRKIDPVNVRLGLDALDRAGRSDQERDSGR